MLLALSEGRWLVVVLRERSLGLAMVVLATALAFVSGLAGAQARDGSAGFGHGGKVRLTDDDEAYPVLIQPGGKLVVGLGFCLARFTADGRPDRTFGKQGRAPLSINTGDPETSSPVALDRSGRIVVVGTYLRLGIDLTDFALARYTRSGRLDHSFGKGGKVVTDFGKTDAASAVTIDQDGKIVVAGRIWDYGSKAGFGVARYVADGRLDRSFGRGGMVLTEFGSHTDAWALALAIQRDRKIVVGGYDHAKKKERVALARYMPDGHLDRSFGTGGKLVTEFVPSGSGNVQAIAIQPDQKIVATGPACVARRCHFVLVRLLRDGRLDKSFGRGGRIITRFGAASADAMALAIQPDGKIIAAGQIEGADSISFAVTRYTPKGSLDQTFGTGGKVLTSLGSYCGGESVAIQKNQKIVVAGCGGLVRLRPDGTLDSG